LVLPFWYQLTRVIPDKVQRAVKWKYVISEQVKEEDSKRAE